MAKRLYRANPNGERRSLRESSAELEKAGHVMTSKYRKQVQPRAFNPATIKAMVEGPMPAGASRRRQERGLGHGGPLTALRAARSEPNRKAGGRNVKCSDGSKRGLDQDPLSLAGFGVYEIGNSQSSVLVGPLAHAPRRSQD
jgi:hypothetical protein